MNKKFTYKVYVPGLQDYRRYTMFDNQTHLSLAKYIQNDDNQKVTEVFEHLIVGLCEDQVDYNTLTCVDKFIILLNIRIMSVSDQFRFETKVGTETESVKKEVAIDLYDILDESTNHPLNTDYELNSPEGYQLILTNPTQFHVERVEDLILHVLKRLTISGKMYDLTNLSVNQKEQILDELPGDSLTNIVKYIKNIDTKYRITVFRSEYRLSDDLANLQLRVYDNSFYEFIKMLYNCNLEEQYYIRYAMTKHMNFNLDQIERMTPIDTRTYIKLYQKELDDQRKASEKNQPTENMAGSLPIPGQL